MMAIEQNNSKSPSMIPMSSSRHSFREFLAIENNKRVFFSGKFGVGKTYFLKEFFREEKKGYDAYHLFPVKYQITSNEDIIKLLRYDILVELVNKYPNLLDVENNQNSVSWLQQVGFFIKQSDIQESLLNCITNVANMIPVLGRPIAETAGFTQAIIKLARGWQETGLQLRQSDINKMYRDVRKYENETNALDTVLNKTIKERKGSKKRKSVLILDDFDRIDPEHIFRILNVFSSLLKLDKDGNSQVDDNKFGFDYVIIVGDKANVENIFRHRYGQDVDFSGYFDKFFSTHPYEFDNRWAVRLEILKFIQKNQHTRRHRSDTDNRNYMELIVQEMLVMILHIDNLNLRALHAWADYYIEEIRSGSSMHFLDQLGQTDLSESKLGQSRNSIQWAVTICLQYLVDVWGKRKLKEIVKQNTEPRALFVFDSIFSEVIIKVLCESNIQPDSEEIAAIKSYCNSIEFSQDKHLAHQYAARSLMLLIDAYPAST